MAAEEPKLTVVVTGCSGYLASHVVKECCEMGYNVRGTVRDKTREDKVAHLEQFEGLELFNADLMIEGSFAEAFEGADVVLHVASPFFLESEDPQKDIVDPAVLGTRNVMEQAVSSGVKRVVVTSSLVAIVSDADYAGQGDNTKIHTHEHWNEAATIETNPYGLSKTLAEKEVWKYKDKLEVCTMNPGFIIGPSLSSRVDGTTMKTFMGVMTGYWKEQGCPPYFCYGTVDVRDVAKAHALSVENADVVNERILLTTPDGIDLLQMGTLLRPQYNSWPLPDRYQAPLLYRPKFDNSKASMILGLKFSPLSKALVDMADDLVAKGLISNPNKRAPEKAKITVAITGCNGFVASHVTKQLVEAGYTVRGTCRDKTNEAKVGHLAQFESLELYNADLLQEGSFAEAFEGVDVVVHTASPFFGASDNPQEELIDPAVNGTKNVMDQAVACGVKRVVVTSSCAAIVQNSAYSGDDTWQNYVYTEADWNTTCTIEDNPYELSKTLAEKEAWKYKDQIEVCTINPAFIVGPSLSTRADGTSTKIMIGMLMGSFKECPPTFCYGCIDVRDVAAAHVAAVDHPEAPGNRFLMSSNDGYDAIQMGGMLRPKFNDYPLPETYKGDLLYRPLYDHSQVVQMLGVKISPLSIALMEMADDLLAKGLVAPPAQDPPAEEKQVPEDDGPGGGEAPPAEDGAGAEAAPEEAAPEQA